jgi:ABC-type antimicrobial peptide transport system permease subunit
MMLARATDREREMTVRAAIGAGRIRLFRQLLTESVVISLLGGAAGALLTYWSVELIKRIIPPGNVRAETIAVDMRVLAFTFDVSLITGVIFGFVPAVRASRQSRLQWDAEGRWFFRDTSKRPSAKRACGRRSCNQFGSADRGRANDQ